MREAFRTELPQKEALQLTNKVYKDGPQILDKDTIKVTGGKLSLGKITGKLKSFAKDLWKRSKPVVKGLAENAIKYAKPLVQEGIEMLGEKMGLDPSISESLSTKLTDYGEKKANRGLRKYVTKKESQTPQEAVGNLVNTIESRARDLVGDFVPTELQDTANNLISLGKDRVSQMTDEQLYGTGLKLYTPDGRMVRVTIGGQVHKNDMSTLLSPMNPALIQFHPPPYLPQGQISGGSFILPAGKGMMKQRKGRFAKGSQEAKDYMARIRAMK